MPMECLFGQKSSKCFCGFFSLKNKSLGVHFLLKGFFVNFKAAKLSKATWDAYNLKVLLILRLTTLMGILGIDFERILVYSWSHHNVSIYNLLGIAFIF